MEQTSNSPLQHKIWIASLLLAPLLLLISQFYWTNGVLTETAGWLQVLAFTFWIMAFHGMFSLVADTMPRYAIIGFLIAVYACIGGNNFGIDGIYSEAMGITDIASKSALHEKFGIGGLISLYIPGLLFPLSLVVLGVNLIRTKSVEWWMGALLIIAGIGFPLSRIPREPMIAHLDNLLLVISHAMLAFRILKK